MKYGLFLKYYWHHFNRSREKIWFWFNPDCSSALSPWWLFFLAMAQICFFLCNIQEIPHQLDAAFIPMKPPLWVFWWITLCTRPIRWDLNGNFFFLLVVGPFLFSKVKQQFSWSIILKKEKLKGCLFLKQFYFEPIEDRPKITDRQKHFFLVYLFI